MPGHDDHENGAGEDDLADASVNLMNSMAETITLTHALARVPIFDGKTLPLRTFIQDLRNGVFYLGEGQEKAYVNAAISKLTGAARNSCNEKTFNTVDELVKHLKERFAQGKNYSYYLNRLSSARMRQGDRVSDYYEYITSLISSAESCLKETIPNAQNRSFALNPIKTLATEIFIRGLPPDIARAVDSRDPTDLTAAYKAAHRIESRMDAKILPDTRPKVNPIDDIERITKTYTDPGRITSSRPAEHYPVYPTSFNQAQRPWQPYYPPMGYYGTPNPMRYYRPPLNQGYQYPTPYYRPTPPLNMHGARPAITTSPPQNQLPVTPSNTTQVSQGIPPTTLSSEGPQNNSATQNMAPNPNTNTNNWRILPRPTSSHQQPRPTAYQQSSYQNHQFQQSRAYPFRSPYLTPRPSAPNHNVLMISPEQNQFENDWELPHEPWTEPYSMWTPYPFQEMEENPQ